MFSFLKELFCIKNSVADYEIYDSYRSNLNNVNSINSTHSINSQKSQNAKYTIINITNRHRMPKVYNIDSECCICFEEEILYAVLKCSHCVCIQCAEKITKCPLCGV
jgi:hypothetical protein